MLMAMNNATGLSLNTRRKILRKLQRIEKLIKTVREELEAILAQAKPRDRREAKT
jgi:hypothetical protein